VTISIRLVFAVNEVPSGSRFIPSAPETFAFLYETFGVSNSFLGDGESTQGEIMDLGLEKNICEKKQRGIWNKTEGRTHSIGDGRAGSQKGFTVQITDQMFNDWVGQHQRLLFGIAYWWTGSRTEAEELTQQAFLQAYPRTARIQRHSKRSPRHREITPHLRLRLAPRRGIYERPNWEIVSRGA
jgi:hypothetical protein